ncbi:MAG: sn-glycerol-1-phosphate dehydrogenase, partial [Clostridia bacterium]
SCGKRHQLDIQEIALDKNCLGKASSFALGKTKAHAMVLCDENTRKIAGEDFKEKMSCVAKTSLHVIPSRNGNDVVPDDCTLGELMVNMDPDIDFFVAVGSGVVNDLTRQASYRTGKEYMVYATAPSMDGYASMTSSLIINHVKKSLTGQLPAGIFADTNILRNAPGEMITAGFGDVIGKYNALREWDFARKYKQEHYCETIVTLVQQAVFQCEKQAGAIRKREEEAVLGLMEALILSGMAMGLNGNTRPASGAEHHVVHYWDVDCIRRGVEHPLHGNAVGVGTLVICHLYELLEKYFPVEVMKLDSGKIKQSMQEAGCATSPLHLGISRELLKESILLGHTMSDKFTVLTYFSKENPPLLEWAAEKICEIFY